MPKENPEAHPNEGTRDFLGKIVGFSVPSWVVFGANIISVAVLTRGFLPADFGKINAFNASATFFMAFLSLGLDSAFVRFYFEPPKGFTRKSLFLLCLGIPHALLLVLGATALALGTSWFSNVSFGSTNPLVFLFLLATIAQLLLFRFLSICFRMEANAWKFGLLSVLFQLASKGGLVLAALTRPDFETAITYCAIAGGTVLTCFFFFLGKNFLGGGGKEIPEVHHDLRDLFSFSISSWPILGLLYFNTYGTLSMIRAFLGDHSVGLYSSMNLFVGVINVFQAGFSTYWSGYMYANYQSQVSRIRRMHDFLSLAMIILVGSFVCFRETIFLILGPNFQATKPFFSLLLLFPVFLILSETTAYGISIAKKAHLMFLFTLFSTFINFSILALFLPKLGLFAACLASAASGLFLFAAQTFYGQKFFISIDNPWRTVFSTTVITTISFANYILSEMPIFLYSTSLLLIFLSLRVYIQETKRAAELLVDYASSLFRFGRKRQ